MSVRLMFALCVPEQVQMLMAMGAIKVCVCSRQSVLPTHTHTHTPKHMTYHMVTTSSLLCLYYKLDWACTPLKNDCMFVSQLTVCE